MAMQLAPVIDWWNDAFQSMKEDGSFRRLCERAERVHGGQSVNQSSNFSTDQEAKKIPRMS